MDLIIRCVDGPHREQQWYLGLQGETLVLRNPGRETVANYAAPDVGSTLVFPNSRKAIRHLHAELADGTKMQFEVRGEDLPTLRALERRRGFVGKRDFKEICRKIAIAIAVVAVLPALAVAGVLFYPRVAIPIVAGLVASAALFYGFRRYRDEKLLRAWTNPGPAHKPLTTFIVDETRQTSDGHWID